MRVIVQQLLNLIGYLPLSVCPERFPELSLEARKIHRGLDRRSGLKTSIALFPSSSPRTAGEILRRLPSFRAILSGSQIFDNTSLLGIIDVGAPRHTCNGSSPTTDGP